MRKASCLLLLALIGSTTANNGCINMWEDTGLDPNVKICPVKTDSGEFCKFPFTYRGSQWNHCITNSPGNSERLPRCLTESNKWQNCEVPTNAAIIGVTTKKGGTSSTNYGSSNGETLVRIIGIRFAPNIFSTSPTAETSNRVKLISADRLLSYDCEIFADASTTTQLTCYTQPMPFGEYNVQVQVKGDYIPHYQISSATVRVANAFTPKIDKIEPIKSVPGSLVDITGDFKTDCFLRDKVGCADDAGARIKRVYVGAQQCNLINRTSNELYQEVTKNNLRCMLEKPEIGYFKTSLIVSNEYGRSYQSPSIAYVSPDSNVYNYQSFAEITSITPNVGSVAGGTELTILGQYLYSDENIPAKVDIAGVPCKVKSFERNNQVDSKLVCETGAAATAHNEYAGNRGVDLMTENGLYTSFNNLENAKTTNATVSSILDSAKIWESVASTKTIWMKGYLYPRVSSVYEFDIVHQSVPYNLFLSNATSSSNKTLIASNRISKPRIYLNADTAYYFELVASTQNRNMRVMMKMKMFETTLTDKDSKFVENEVQDIDITSTIDRETYSITGLPNSTVSLNGKGEIQSLVIKPASFILSFNGAESATIESGASASSLKAILNDMPSLYPNLVTAVTEKDAGGDGKEYLIEFSPDLGNVPEIVQASKFVTSTVKTVSEATVPGKKSHLIIDGIQSGLFDLRDTAASIKEVLDKSFGIRCPVSINNENPKNAVTFDFENDCPTNDHRPLSDRAFCGKCARTWNQLFYQDTPLDKNYVCFAYKLTVPVRRIYFQVIDLFQESYVNFVTLNAAGDNKWHYACFDIYARFKEAYNTKFSGKQLKLRQAWLWPSPQGPILLDAVSIRKNLPVGIEVNPGTEQELGMLNKRRIIPIIQATSEKQNSLTVTKNADAVTFAFRPDNCMSNLPLITLVNSFKSNTAMNRTLEASGPVTGSFDITWNGNSLDNIQSNITSNELAALLKSLQNFGDAQVVRTRDCAGYKWSIKWLNGGNKPPIELKGNHSLSGNKPILKAVKSKEGGVFFEPVQDDMIKTFHAYPQVSVMINNIPSQCSDCKFEWSLNATPIVDIINSTTLSAIEISGSNFSEVAENNVVLVGKTPCTVISSSKTKIICSSVENSVGTYKLTVNVIGKGFAMMNTNVTVNVPLVVSSFEPKLGFNSGGNIISINGTGFSKQTNVLIDQNDCKIINASYSLLKCIVPFNPTLVDKNVSVIVFEKEYRLNISEKYQYKFNNDTPVIETITPDVLSVLGGEDITVTGKRFPNVTLRVKFGDHEVELLSSNETHLVLKSPSLKPGRYSFNLAKSANDFIGNNLFVTYNLYVSSFTPQVSSIRGGVMVHVEGDGFNPDCAKNDVTFGPQKCKVSNCADKWITCKTSSSYLIHDIDNSAADPFYGTGYAWNKPYLSANIGDTVRWTWKPTEGVSTVKYKVLQVNDSISEDPVGFDSGAATLVGQYSYQFNKAGIYHYWSGYVESSGIINFRGVIEIVNSVDKELEINVKVNDFNAQKCSFPFTYNSTTYNKCTNETFGYNWCSPYPKFQGQILKCDSLDNSTYSKDECAGSPLNSSTCGVNSTSIYNMKFTQCSNNMAKIIAISQQNITSKDNLTISGSGFGLNQCENQIIIGNVICPLIKSSASELVCKLDSNSGLIPNFDYPIEVLVKGVGYALQADSFKIKFLPYIETYSPTIGSIAGGTQLLIKGDGFMPEQTSIQIGQSIFYSTVNAKVNHESILIETSTEKSGKYEIKVFSNSAQAVCIGSCEFEFTSTNAPQINSVSPQSLNTSSIVTIVGKNFGVNATAVSVKIGENECNVTSIEDVKIKCFIKGISEGSNLLTINVIGIGNALNSSSITGNLNLESIKPNKGSIYGSAIIKILGNGFNKKTSVFLGNFECKVTDITASEIRCKTSGVDTQRSIVDVPQVVKINNAGGSIFSKADFVYTYSSSATPNVTSISPDNGNGGNVIIQGSGFGNNTNNIVVHGCNITNVSDNEILCELEASSAGNKSIYVSLETIGVSNMNTSVMYSYFLGLTNLSSHEGSMGGGLKLEIKGNGFSEKTEVTICDKACKLIANSFTSMTCIVPQSNITDRDTQCDLNINENNQTVSGIFTYKLSLTPKIFEAAPLRGGTGGGTLIKINGTGFPTNASLVSVSIAGSECIIAKLTETEIHCKTEPYRKSSIKASIDISIENKGLALNNGSLEFEYIDLWSSKFTWGGLNPPGKGELAVIGPNQHIYFDAANTPVLKGVIIQGGSLIFDDNQDVSLNAEYIIILDGGKFQVGTEEKPFVNKATITMFGSIRSTELPIYGAKVIGVRNGTLDLHGKPIGVTWTTLNATAQQGSDKLVLKEEVDWPIGSLVAIATTGDKLSSGESESAFITKKSGNELTLDKALKFTHLAEERTVGVGANSYTVHVKAEVGLLSRNVLFKGHDDDSWSNFKSAEACPSGFNPKEFATQTCFLGRYGPELGTDEFGATILISAPMSAKHQEVAITRISNVELYHVGQAFRKGRYPIHFHMNGDMKSSYVKESSIHQSFNRAVNIHASNYVTVERNVIYNIMGGAYFMEDGIEIGNEFKYNLAIFVRTSSSLLNEDATPAAFWVTNPNNTYLHNAVAGSTHFGYWYRITDRPEGPSYTNDYCPKKIPFGRFANNSVHSTGRFGLWIFPGYTPTLTGDCGDNSKGVAVIEDFVAYNNDKGGEAVNSNVIQFKNFTLWDHDDTGIDTKIIRGNDNLNSGYKNNFYNEENGPLIANGVIIGDSKNNQSSGSGIILPWDRGLLIKNVAFYNFPGNEPAMKPTEISGTCMSGCGGWVNQVSDLKFSGVKYRNLLRWNWDNVMQDLDGSLTGKAGDVVVYKDDISSAKSSCRDSDLFKNGIVCSNTSTMIRFAFNNYKPSLAKTWVITNEFNKSVSSPWLFKRLTHKEGFMMILEANQEYTMYFENVSPPSNLSYVGRFYGLKPNDYIYVKHPLSTKPDQVYLNNKLQTQYLNLTTFNNTYGDWMWDNSTSSVVYLVKNIDTLPFQDFEVNFFALKCRYVGCKPPVSPASKEPIKSRPADALFWSKSETWRLSTIGVPKDGDVVTIPEDQYIVVDTELPKLENLIIEGTLEFDNNREHYLEVDFIFINGGQLIIGWENDPITKNVEIVLTGQKNDPSFKLPNQIEFIGGKGIGVYGGLDLHGAPVAVPWTRLNETAKSGSSQIRLIKPVDWKEGDQILLTTTSYILEHTEIMNITSVSADNMTLNLSENLKYDHLAYSERFDDNTGYEVAAGVGLLSRNIKIIAKEYPEQQKDLYGSRIIISDYNAVRDDALLLYKGFMRASNVEMVRPGQFDRGGDDDSKYGVLISNLGDHNDKRPTYIKSSSFHHGLGTAIGILSSNNITIESNVIHYTIDYGVRVEGKANRIISNLVTMNYWGSTILQQEAGSDRTYWGAIDISKAESAIIEDNFIAGAERVGLNYRGDVCDGNKLDGHSIKGNIIYGAGAGAVIVPEDAFKIDCVRISGFTIFKSQYFGIYYQSTSELVIDSSTLIDNQIGAFTIIFSPSAKSHIVTTKKYYARDLVIVGKSKGFDCEKDIYPKNISDSKNMMNTFGAGANDTGKIGLVWPTFIGGSNMCPKKPWTNLMSYNQNGGEMKISNVSFINFKTQCGEQDIAIASSKFNEDGQHPVTVANTRLFNVDNSSKVFIHRPSLGSINPSDCIDMNCDGLKKNLLTDLDGSFLGQKGSVISQSEFGWGSQQRGLGDFRIPKEMLSSPNGSFVSPSSVYKYPGIVRDQKSCKYIDEWQAYECFGLRYNMLVIESMDKDTEDRRLSPVAILSDNKYLDLINGPQDHGWCFGYTCQKRISTFLALVAADKSYDIYLTSTPPDSLRFTLINSDPSFKIRLSMFYSTAQRIDLYKNLGFITPTNAYYDNGKMKMKDPSLNLASYMPTYKKTAGENLFYQPDKKIYFATDGGSVIELKIAPVLVLSFGLPAITPEEFFNPVTIVGNFAKLLGIDPSKIRRVQIVRESRKRRQIGQSLSFIKLTIEENAANSTNGTETDEIKNEFTELNAKITNLYATNEIQSQANKTLGISLASLILEDSNGNAQNLKKISKIVLVNKLNKCAAQAPCQVQPIIQVLDDQGDLVTDIGSDEKPWIIQATLKNSSNPDSKLFQNEAIVKDGSAKFTAMGITAIDPKFSFLYTLKSPEGFNSTFESLSVSGDEQASISPSLTCMQSEMLVVEENEKFEVEVKIVDKFSRTVFRDLSFFENQTLMVNASMHDLKYYKPTGMINPNNSGAYFNGINGTAKFSDLSIDKAGMYLLDIKFNNRNSSYAFSDCLSRPIEVRRAKAVFTTDFTAKPNYVLKFNGSANEVDILKPDVRDVLKTNVYNLMSSYSVKAAGLDVFTDFFVTFWSADFSNNLRKVLAEQEGIKIYDNLTYSYAEIDGESFGNRTDIPVTPFFNTEQPSTGTTTKSVTSISLPVTGSTQTKSSTSIGLPVTGSTPTKSSTSIGLPVTGSMPTKSSTFISLPVTGSTPTKSSTFISLPVTGSTTSKAPTTKYTTRIPIATKKTCTNKKHKHHHHKRSKLENRLYSAFHGISDSLF